MNCKPGDLAIIIRSRLAPENIGRIVEVICPSGAPGKPSWIVKSSRPLVVRWEDGWVARSYERRYLDICLRPVTGLPIGEDRINDIKEPA
jgi:hypothetical protein